MRPFAEFILSVFAEILHFVQNDNGERLRVTIVTLWVLSLREAVVLSFGASGEWLFLFHRQQFFDLDRGRRIRILFHYILGLGDKHLQRGILLPAGVAFLIERPALVTGL